MAPSGGKDDTFLVIDQTDEVLRFAGSLVAPQDSPARNWAFDVTPAGLIDGYITDRGLLSVAELGEVWALPPSSQP
ncbi:MAG: hypothetical protein ACR2HR_00090 [Euzebya sp.]